MQDIVKSQRNKLEMGDLNQQYLILKHVNLDDFVKIDDVRDSIGKRIRMTNYLDIYLLIVKEHQVHRPVQLGLALLVHLQP
jgi:hypothetical protein